MAKTPDSHAGGPGFKSRCRPTNFGAHLPYTPPPGRKDASRVGDFVLMKMRDIVFWVILFFPLEVGDFVFWVILSLCDFATLPHFLSFILWPSVRSMYGMCIIYVHCEGIA